MSGSVYEVLQEGNWKFRVIKADSVIPIGFGEVGYEVALVTYSKNIAEICCSALNASVEKPNAPQQPQQAICRKCSGKGYNVSLVGDGVGVQHISEHKRKCRYCNGSGKQLAVR